MDGKIQDRRARVAGKAVLIGAGVSAVFMVATSGGDRSNAAWEGGYWAVMALGAATMGACWPKRTLTIAVGLAVGLGLAAPLAARGNDDGLWIVVYFFMPVLIGLWWLCALAGAAVMRLLTKRRELRR